MTQHTGMTQQHAALTPEAVVGTWVSPSGYIRLRLQPDGRYHEAHGCPHKHAYHGRYVVHGERLDLAEDSGFHSIGIIHADVLSLGSDRFLRER